MRKILALFFMVLLVARTYAQSNAPVRLALIAEGDESSQASDILTVELSKNPQIKLLERNEIEKVYREQGLSAANRDYLKLGQVLGADGVLLLRANPTSDNAPAMAFGFARNAKPKIDLNIQLIAVGPGVLLTSERFSGIDDISQWAPGFVAHLNPLLPKLTVLPQDAVPISIVNLRAAIQSPETQEAERQITALTIERLSHEPRLFVLERRKLQLLAQEKQLKGLDDSAFWKGSYLLDGTMDRNGYSKDRMTISARLVPPRGGAPLQIEVSGSRTNLSEVINQLADKVRESLKLAASAAPWNSADEAEQYFSEAKWALRWSIFEEAQAASESAWELGKQDTDCVLVRMDAYAHQIPIVDPLNLSHPISDRRITFVDVTAPPDPAEVDRALRLLQVFEAFNRGLTLEEPRQNSPLYFSGLDALEKATGVLRHFHFHPDSQKAVSEKLGELRAEARRVAARLSQPPSVRATYWIGGRLPDTGHDEVYHDFEERIADGYRRMRNLYQAELQWGCFWQEKPEDTCALYRSLMGSPLFVCIQNDLWFRSDDSPRLAAWSVEDKERTPEVWRGFINELDNSTNYFFRLEARISEFTDAEINRRNGNRDWGRMPQYGEPGYRTMESVYAERDQIMESAWRKLIDFTFVNYDAIVTGREQLLKLGLGLGGFFSHSGEVIPAADKLENEFRTVDTPRLQALHDEYSQRNAERLTEMENRAAFEKQRQYLAAFTAYDFQEFNTVFSDKEYSKAQAAELKPLLEAYQSNMIAQASVSSTNRFQKFRADGNVHWIAFTVGKRVDEILNPKPPSPLAAPSATPMAPPPLVVVTNIPPMPPGPLTNIFMAKRFVGFPKELLPATNLSGITVFGHRLRDDKLLLDLRYRDDWWEQEGPQSGHERTFYREAAAIWTAGSGWSVTPFEHVEDYLGAMDFVTGSFGGAGKKSFLEMFGDALYVSDRDAIRRYDLKTKQWQELPYPGQNRAQLFPVDNRLYAASSEGIWEILDSGRATRILASIRRRPVASFLDSRETLGQPILFSGRNDSLKAALNGEVFAWDGSDWKSVLTIAGDQPPEIYKDAVFFRGQQYRQGFDLWRLVPNEPKPVLCLHEPGGGSAGIFGLPAPVRVAGAVRPLWHSFPGLSQKPLTPDASAIYFIVDRTKGRSNSNPKASPLETRGRHADLVCLVPESAEPVIVPIRFDSNAGFIPAQSRQSFNNTIWIECSSESLFIGGAELPGIWVLQKSAIKAEVARQVQERRTENERLKKTVFAKYDLNRNGVLDSDEKESAINDPEFLEFERNQIDTNDNDKLDGEELAYFDANENGILDPPEEAGIHEMQKLLAARLFRKLDQDEDGQIDPNEFRPLFDEGGGLSSAYQLFKNARGQSENERLTKYLEFSTESVISQNISERTRLRLPMQAYAAPQTFKGKVEDYWVRHNSNAISHKEQIGGSNLSKEPAP